MNSPAAREILFEPWGLGDALIACAVMREEPGRFALACRPDWIPLLRAAMPEQDAEAFIPVDLKYTTRKRTAFFDTEGLKVPAMPFKAARVLTIRGDLRDFIIARRLFPGVRVRMSGLCSFVTRRSRLLDLPFALGLLRVRNRYRAWCDLTGIPFERLCSSYASRLPAAPPREAVIHVGAQWKSRQYPRARKLKEALEAGGLRAEIAAGPGDQLPDGVGESGIRRYAGTAIVERLFNKPLVFANDSGPMHLAAFMGCPVVVAARVSNIEEWLPPLVRAVTSPRMPRGYRPDDAYCSDCVLDGWETYPVTHMDDWPVKTQ